MSKPVSNRVHLIAGGFPAGSCAGHNIDYARINLLKMLSKNESTTTTVASDFEGIEKWLPGCRLLVTYVAGPFPNAEQCNTIDEWLNAGGCWLALHGTSGGKAARIPDSYQRRMVKMPHHEVLGSFFLNHPPVRKFSVDTTDHPLTKGLPSSFDVSDELYILEMQDPDLQVLLTTQLDKDPSPEGFGFLYDEDTTNQKDPHTRVLGYLRNVGEGSVIYYGLGHCHTPETNVQPFVDASVEPSGKTPLHFSGPWETDAFNRLLQNAIEWSMTA